MTNQVTQDFALIARMAVEYISALEHRVNELERKVRELERVPSAKLLSINDIAEFFGVNRRTVRDRWIPKPGFPPPRFAPSPRTRRWDRDEIIIWAKSSRRKTATRSIRGC